MIIQLTMCVNVKWVFTKVIRICFMLFFARENRDEEKEKSEKNMIIRFCVWEILPCHFCHTYKIDPKLLF